MDASQDRAFHYHGAANALGGVLTHPHRTVITTTANTALANAGGHNSSPKVPFQLEQVLSCDSAYTHVSGVEEPEHWTTLTTAVVEKVNLMEVVTADKIVSQIVSRHPREGQVPAVSFLGSQFVNLRINGQPVNPVLNLDPFGTDAQPQHGRAPAKSKSSKNRGPKPEAPQVCSFHCADVRKMARKQCSRMISHPHAPDWVKHRYGWLASDDGIDGRSHLVCTLVDEVRGSSEELTFGHVIHVPGFGNLFLAEISLDAKSFHLTMLRAEMGCASSGTVSIATSTTNGSTHP